MAAGPNHPSTDATDEQLVEQYRHGDDAAFAQLVRRYRRELFNFLARYCGNRTVADDLFQESFLQVHLSADRFDTQKRFKPWLFTIAANKTRDYLRSNRRQASKPLLAPIAGADEGTAYADLLEADLPLPGAQVEAREQQEMVRQAVEALPDHLREVLLLAYFHQFSYREIAQMLSIPIGTVKSRLHAAVSAFATEWKRRG
jgi:RNA polymerase sigma-70 factor (ECF subfamily)